MDIRNNNYQNKVYYLNEIKKERRNKKTLSEN